MSQHIERITIADGGTADWPTALILNRLLNRDARSGGIAIALIESPNVPTIGVGESTNERSAPPSEMRIPIGAGLR